ncbi:MAG: hypothetical protein ACYDBB_08815 [Armatimonadota bacterium]
MAISEDTQALITALQPLQQIAEILAAEHTASQVLQQHAQQVLDAQQAQLQETSLPDEIFDPYPFLELPAGTMARDIPDGGRLFTLADGLLLRTLSDGAIVAIGSNGTPTTVAPARGGIVTLPDGRILLVHPDTVQSTYAAAGIAGLPTTVMPIQVDTARVQADFPDGVRLVLYQDRQQIILVNPCGAVDAIGLGCLNGFGETVTGRPLSGGSVSFTTDTTGHRGVIEPTGTIHLALASGQELTITFPDSSEPVPDDHTGQSPFICEACYGN